MNNMLLPEDILREAVLNACERENAAYNKLVTEREKPVFSHDFEKNIAKLKKEIKHTKTADIIEYPHTVLPKKRLRLKIALIAMIIMMFGSMTVMAVEPIREKVYQIIETFFPDHTDISFKEVKEDAQENETDSQTRSFNPADFPKKLKWVPEGFELVQEEIDSDLFYLMQTYINPQKQYLAYDQMLLENTNGLDLTSNGEVSKEITINGKTGYLFTDDDNYHIILYMHKGFAYKIGGYLNEADLIKCLENTLLENK